MTAADPFEAKIEALDRALASMGRIAVAFSGGVDSTVLLHAVHRVLGKEDGIAVIADSPSLPGRELHEAREVAELVGARWWEVRTDEGSDPSYRANAGDRCYFCKAALFRAMESFAREESFPSSLSVRSSTTGATIDLARGRRRSLGWSRP